MRLGALLALLLAAAAAGPARIPGALVDVDGERVELAALAGSSRVFVVTLKSASCPVCARQLARIERQRAAFERCGASFLVLAPGPAERLRALRSATNFGGRWIEDVGLRVGDALGLVLGPAELVPAILEVDARGRVLWQQRGRSDQSFGDGALRERLDCVPQDT